MSYIKKIFSFGILLGILFGPARANNSVLFVAQEYSKNFVNFTTDAQCELSEIKKREIICELFFNNIHSIYNDLQISKIIAGSSLFDDIGLIANIQQNASLFDKINNTETTFGEIALLCGLSSPSTDIELLQHRQNIIQKIAEDPVLFEHINSSLKDIKNIEDDILGFWLKDSEEIENLFYKNKFLKNINKSAAKLEFFSKLNLTFSWLIAHIYDAHKIILGHETEVFERWPEFLKEFVIATINPKKIFIDPANNIIRSWKDGQSMAQETSKSILKKIALVGQEPLLDKNIKAAYIKNMLSNLEFVQKNEAILPYMPYILACSNLLVESHGLYLKYSFYKNIIKKRKAILRLKDRLSKIKILIKKTKRISSILDIHFDEKFNFKKLSRECKNLVKEMKASTFDPDTTLIYEGRVLKCYKQMQNIKNEFANMLIYIGQVDAYLSCAKLIKKENLCFVKFINIASPQINAENFWSLFLEQNRAIKNSLSMIGNIILTGPNAGGKSTILKIFLQNLLLAQTFGIAAAQEFEFTPFSSIFSYLNIVDDLSSNKSLFKAEVERAKKIISGITSLDKNQFAFCVIDELFTGTNFEAGQLCALEFIKKLNNYENAIFIFATHYQNLTNLERQDNRFLNYKVGAPEKIGMQSVYPFTLEKGINTYNSAFDILEEAGLI